mgnify:CR=1 FL=1
MLFRQVTKNRYRPRAESRSDFLSLNLVFLNSLITFQSKTP